MATNTGTIFLVAGYRRTGKDMLFNILSNPDDSTSRFKWRVYKHPDNEWMEFRGDGEYQRLAFADQLKREASLQYGIPLVVSDAEKDRKQFIHYQTGAQVSARDIYIEWGAVRRAENPNYWCAAAAKQVTDPNMKYVVTDWRYRNESRYIIKTLPYVVTVRVYRSEVPEPDLTIESEHDLDAETTHTLLLREDDHEKEFVAAVKRFPQYQDFVPCETL
jgi:hypothetical protein